MTDDSRDEQLGEALAVPPLDDVTRRRLVRNALAASAADAASDDQAGDPADAAPPQRRSWAPLAAAAVVILLVVVGLVALGQGGDDSSSDTAARKADRVPTAETPAGQAPTAAADSSGAAASLVPGILDLGDLGNLSNPASRERARAALTTGPLEDSEAATTLSGEQLLQDVAAARCAAPLRADGTTVVGVGSATVDGEDAVVVVTETAGARAPFVLVLQPCALSPL